MANTVIQLKWSDVTSSPITLTSGEAAYSNTTQKLFIGDSSGNVLTIGGKYFTDQQPQIFTKANGAFDAANSAGSYANSAFATANSASGPAGSYANSAFTAANSAGSYANSAFGFANTTYSNYAYPAYIQAGSAAAYANSAFAAANGAIGTDLTQNTNITNASSYANSAFLQANTPSYVANSAASYANSAFIRANNSINANTGGTISGDLSITGNLSVLGNTFTVSASQIVANDTMIILGQGNYTSDILDIGFAAHYNGGTNAHTGLIRDSGTKEWQLFEGYTPEIGANNNIDINDASFKLATLNANLHSTTILVKGIDLLPYVNNSYTAANTADAKAVTAGSYANSAFAAANSAGTYANSAFLQANTPSYTANSAASYANSGFAVANSAASYANSGFAVANSAASYANSGFAVANSASSYANAAFAKANTDFTNVSTTSGYYGNTAAVIQLTLEANGRISQANTTSIAIAASQITSGTLGVSRGGTGAATFTTNAVLLGQGTSAFTTASSSTEGHVLTINNSGVPTFSYIQGGTF